MTAYLAAAFLYAIYEEVPKSGLKRPLSLMIPVNLRNFFPSGSMTNFWSWIETAWILMKIQSWKMYRKNERDVRKGFCRKGNFRTDE